MGRRSRPPGDRGRSAIDAVTEIADFMPEWPPNRINASDDGWRSYSSQDSVLIQTDGVTRCAVSSSSTIFVSVFGPVFTFVFVLVCWFWIDPFRERIAFMTLGLFCGTATFGMIYALMRHHKERGDYIVVDGVHDRIELPRHDRVFDAADVRCLQLLTGRDKNDEVINNSDLNLLVAEGDDIVRYHLIGNPNKEHAKAVATAMHTPLIEQSVPRGWYRSSDRQDNEMHGGTGGLFSCLRASRLPVPRDF